MKIWTFFQFSDGSITIMNDFDRFIREGWTAKKLKTFLIDSTINRIN